MSSNNTDLIPIVVIVGSTAVGKTKLAIDICKSLDGEVISADSMQVCFLYLEL